MEITYLIEDIIFGTYRLILSLFKYVTIGASVLLGLNVLLVNFAEPSGFGTTMITLRAIDYDPHRASLAKYLSLEGVAEKIVGKGRMGAPPGTQPVSPITKGAPTISPPTQQVQVAERVASRGPCAEKGQGRLGEARTGALSSAETVRAQEDQPVFPSCADATHGRQNTQMGDTRRTRGAQ